MRNLGTVQFESVHGAYLQAHADNGQLHCSNPHVNQEETWFLIEIDPSRHLYAVQNWLTGHYMYKGDGSDTVLADQQTIGALEQWVLIPGEHYGAPGAVCFQAHDGWIMATNRPGDNFPRHDGEVYSSHDFPPMNFPGWAGWWTPQPANPNPTPGNNVCNTLGSMFNGILVNIGGIVVDDLFTALGA